MKRLAYSALLLCACSSVRLDSCTADNISDATVARGVKAYVLCSAERVPIGVEADASSNTLRTEDDALNLVRERFGIRTGRRVATAVLSFESAGNRSMHTIFYEHGVLELQLEHDARNEQHVRAFIFWRYRQVVDTFTQCTSVIVQSDEKSPYQLIGKKGAVYSPNRPASCDGKGLEHVMAAGPTDRSYPKPSVW